MPAVSEPSQGTASVRQLPPSMVAEVHALLAAGWSTEVALAVLGLAKTNRRRSFPIETIERVKTLLASGMPVGEVAVETGVSRQYVTQIKNGYKRVRGVRCCHQARWGRPANSWTRKYIASVPCT